MFSFIFKWLGKFGRWVRSLARSLANERRNIDYSSLLACPPTRVCAIACAVPYRGIETTARRDRNCPKLVAALFHIVICCNPILPLSFVAPCRVYVNAIWLLTAILGRVRTMVTELIKWIIQSYREISLHGEIRSCYRGSVSEEVS